MTALSDSLSALAESFRQLEGHAQVVEPEAMAAIRRFLETAAGDARKLERMLERRLKAECLPGAAAPPGGVPALSGRVVAFRGRRRSLATRGGGDAA